jgi:hypothetical protein
VTGVQTCALPISYQSRHRLGDTLAENGELDEDETDNGEPDEDLP